MDHQLTEEFIALPPEQLPDLGVVLLSPSNLTAPADKVIRMQVEMIFPPFPPISSHSSDLGSFPECECYQTLCFVVYLTHFRLVHFPKAYT